MEIFKMGHFTTLKDFFANLVFQCSTLIVKEFVRPCWPVQTKHYFCIWKVHWHLLQCLLTNIPLSVIILVTIFKVTSVLSALSSDFTPKNVGEHFPWWFVGMRNLHLSVLIFNVSSPSGWKCHTCLQVLKCFTVCWIQGAKAWRNVELVQYFLIILPVSHKQCINYAVMLNE